MENKQWAKKIDKLCGDVIDELHSLHHRYIGEFLNGHAKQVNRIIYPFAEKLISTARQEGYKDGYADAYKIKSDNGWTPPSSLQNKEL